MINLRFWKKREPARRVYVEPTARLLVRVKGRALVSLPVEDLALYAHASSDCDGEWRLFDDQAMVPHLEGIDLADVELVIKCEHSS